MQKDDKISFFLGLFSYLMFLATLLLKVNLLIIGVTLGLFGFIIPDLKNAELGGLPFLLLAYFISIFIFPFTFWLISKIIKIQIKIGPMIVGFLLTAVLLNIVKLITGWPT